MPFTLCGEEDNNTKYVITSGDNSEMLQLILLLDNLKVKFKKQTDKPLVSNIAFFFRSFGNDVLVRKEDGLFLFKPELDCIPEGTTLSDSTLVLARDLVCRLYQTDKSDLSRMEKLAFCAFPTPFGLYADDELKSNVALMQICVNTERLDGLSEEFEFVPVEDTELLDFISENFNDVAFKKVGEKK